MKIIKNNIKYVKNSLRVEEAPQTKDCGKCHDNRQVWRYASKPQDVSESQVRLRGLFSKRTVTEGVLLATGSRIK